MSLSNNKKIILRRLSLEPGPISLPELLAKLDKSYKERSVRRWLRDLVNEGAVKQLGKKRSTKYIVFGFKFDEVRVRYRQQRRSLIRDVIMRGLVGKSLKEYLEIEAKKLVPLSVHLDFIGDVMEDLSQMDESRIAGLGITSAELQQWIYLRDKDHPLGAEK